MIEKIHNLANGRKYRVIDTGIPYEIKKYEYSAETYPIGGYLIHRWSEISNEWMYIDHSPDQKSVDFCLKAFAKMAP